MNRLPSSVLNARQEQSPSQRVFFFMYETAFSISPHPMVLPISSPESSSQLLQLSISLRLAALSECGILPVLFHHLWASSLPSWHECLSGFFVFERDSLNSKHSKFLVEAADRLGSVSVLCLGLALLWSFPDLPATVPKTSVVGYRSKMHK